MIQQFLDYIYQNNILQQFPIKKDNQKIEIETRQYVISIEFYDCHVVEEIIYDKSKQEVYFYFHHDCFDEYQTIDFLNDFLDIVFSLICNKQFIDFWDLKDYKNLNDNPCYLQNQF